MAKVSTFKTGTRNNPVFFTVRGNPTNVQSIADQRMATVDAEVMTLKRIAVVDVLDITEFDAALAGEISVAEARYSDLQNVQAWTDIRDQIQAARQALNDLIGQERTLRDQIHNP